MRINHNPLDILPNPTRFVSNFSVFQNTLNYFTVKNSVVLIGTTNVDTEKKLMVQDNFLHVRKDIQTSNFSYFPFPKVNFLEPYYSIPFAIYAIPSLLLEYWESSREESNLHLPNRNIFIPNISSIITRTLKTSTVPEVICNRTALQVWTLEYNIKHTPNINLKCQLTSVNAVKQLQWHGKYI